MRPGAPLLHYDFGNTLKPLGFEFERLWRDVDVIKLRVSAWNGAFGGATVLYVGIDELEEVAGKLQGFPSDPQDSREITIGTFDRVLAGGGVRLRFFCKGKVGEAYDESTIEFIDNDTNALKIAQSVTFSLPLEPASVDCFVLKLRALGNHQVATAVLEGARPVEV